MFDCCMSKFNDHVLEKVVSHVLTKLVFDLIRMHTCPK